MLVLDEHRSEVVRSLCELIVPGSARVGPRGLHRRAARADARRAARADDSPRSTRSSSRPRGGAEPLAEHMFTPEFMSVRALACEAFYSDFVAPGAPGPGAWEEIDFRPPLAARLDKDWSYLGVEV